MANRLWKTYENIFKFKLYQTDMLIQVIFFIFEKKSQNFQKDLIYLNFSRFATNKFSKFLLYSLKTIVWKIPLPKFCGIVQTIAKISKTCWLQISKYSKKLNLFGNFVLRITQGFWQILPTFWLQFASKNGQNLA